MRDENCTRCKLHQNANFVCLMPPIKQKEAVIVGEAPGKKEDEVGKPFIGPSGELLDEYLKEVGIDRSDVYITNSVLCRPPGNRTPKTSEIKACAYWYNLQIEAIKPKYMLILGAVALQQSLGLKNIKKLRGKPIEKDGIIYVPTFHPSMILRDPRQKCKFKADLQLFSNILECGGIPREESLNYKIVNDQKTWDLMIDDLYGSISYDIETKGLYPWDKSAGINSLGFGTKRHQWLIPTDEYTPDEETLRVYDKNIKYGWTRAKILSLLELVKARCDEGDIKLVMQNGKFDMVYTWVRYGVRLISEFDTMLAHFLIDENDNHGLKYLSKVYFGAPDYDTDEEVKTGKKGYLSMAEYQAHDLYYTRKLKFKLKAQLEKEPSVKQVFYKIMMPCSNLFTEVEYHGVYINVKKMDEAEVYLRDIKREAEKELNRYLPKKYVGTDFNWGSTKQLGELLFEELRLPVVTRTPTGKPQVNESVLKQLDHPMVKSLLKLRAANQQLSFFIDGWKPFLDGKRLHPNFKLHGTVTGRLSCDRPNLQQVPRDPRIRSLIGAPKGWALIEADLSQIELRIAAELSNDRGLMYAFTHGIDVHWLTALKEMERSGAMPQLILKTACSVTGRSIKNYGEACEIILKAGPKVCEEVDEVWKELRKKAKAINFGYLYGMWWKKFRQYALDNYGVKVTDEQAQASRKNYFMTYPDLERWHKSQKQFVRNNGYVASLSGRKRRLIDATLAEDCPERGAAERQAINSPVQSFANELNLMALIQLRAEFSNRVLHPVGTVHDAILVEVREDYVERVYNRILEIMSCPALLDDMGIKVRVPIEAEAKIGAWGKGVSLKKWLEENNND